MCTLALSLIATGLGTYMSARSQRSQYESAANQAQYNAQIQEQNAKKMLGQAEEASKNSAMNEESKRRKMLAFQGQQRAAAGASGVSGTTGSYADVLGDTAWNQEYDLAVERYNNSQTVSRYYDESNNYDMQSAAYKQQASDYRGAAKRAYRNTLIQGALTMASSLYSPQSAASQSGSGSSSKGLGVGLGYNYKDNIYDYHTGTFGYAK